MAKEFGTKIVTANDLLDGDVIYMKPDGGWTRQMTQAAIAQNEAEAEVLLSRADQPGAVVGPYLFDVALSESGHPIPAHFRERFRDLGPSNRRDLGRQADASVVTVSSH